MSDARTVAHDVLVRVATTEAFADRLLGHRLARAGLGEREQALATQLVYGTLAWQGRIDYHLARLVRSPLTDVEPPVHAALRLGFYQLLRLTRVPAYAAVDASVRLARAASGPGAGGLVNAVLRRAAAGKVAELPLPEAADDPLARLAVEWSHPRWLVERWAAELGSDELPALLAADNQPSGTALRVNALRTTRDELRQELAAARVEVEPGSWATSALCVAHGGARLRSLAAYREGRFAFQGEASQLVVELLDPQPGWRVLDACAAPGGKSAHVASLIGGPGLTVALDARPRGLAQARAEARRLGVDRLRVAVADARRPPLRGGLDAVLVDAPCSGLGTLRRHPELRWRRTPEDIPRLAALQRELLLGVAPLLRPGGVLVYAVCTLAREENEDVVAALRARHPRFAVEPAAERVPPALTTAEGYLRTLPHRHGLDGFFAARLRARS